MKRLAAQVQVDGSLILHALDKQTAGDMHCGPAVVSHVAPSAAEGLHVPVVEPVGMTHVPLARQTVYAVVSDPHDPPAVAVPKVLQRFVADVSQ